ncbi:MAG: zinc ribbon domain-containing protein [Chloroflexi bacterium]|nr:MAG: zinc ribbon domain-containing protein [Chloroflexota bacterium]
MEIGAIFLLLAVVLLVTLFVARPFIEHRRVSVISSDEHELSSLLAERDRLITALQELDFDHTLGKIPTEDYPSMRADLMRHAADVLQKLDAHTSPNGQASAGNGDAESRIEAVIAARRADAAVQKSAASEPASDDDLEALIASRKAARKEKSAGFCPKCGKPVLRSDRFCPHCGKSIK